jgi:hypothetical protein
MIDISSLVNFLNSTPFFDLDEWISEYAGYGDGLGGKALLKECSLVIKSGDYEWLATTMNKQIGTRMKPHTAELFIKFLYNRLTNTPTEMNQLILRKIR